MTDKTYKKKLIEVALPLEAINKASAREKSIRHGHPSTLHLWWARRPLAACRAVLFAQLVDDPSSHPDKFPTPEGQDVERQRLFKIIEDLVIWENSTNEEVLERARAEILKSCGGKLPPVYDPFSGGCSIPLEAQRLGLPAYGSDLNPVAVMIGKAMIEIPPKFKNMKPIHPGEKERGFGDYKNTEGLVEDVMYYGQWMRDKAYERIGHLYPEVDLPAEYGGGKTKVIAWIWTRTVPSPDPAFADTNVPIASSFAFSTKKNKEAWVEPIVDKASKSITYRMHHGGTKEEIANAREGTKAGRAVFRCLLSGSPITGAYINEMADQGRMKQSPIAVVAEGRRSRIFLSPDQTNISQSVENASSLLLQSGLDISYLETPCRGTFASNAQGRRYGFHQFRDYFTDRQLLTLGTLSELIIEVLKVIETDSVNANLAANAENLENGGNQAKAYAEAICVYLAFAISRSANTLNSIARWTPDRQQTVTAFARQGVTMSWDFPEVNPFSGAAGDFMVSVGGVMKGMESLGSQNMGSQQQHDAQTVVLAESSVISTDPPYYDNIVYSDLSDFFYCWLKSSLRSVYPNIFSSITTPKSEELVANRYRQGSPEEAERFFLNGMRQAISNFAEQTTDEFPSTIYYAFKQNEITQEGISSTGWATFLQAVMESGYSVVGTWPMRTEMANRMIATGTNALANSVVLVCRKKEETSEEVTRAEFIRALKNELPAALTELQSANIAPADMPQSSIGPGIGIFSRYKTVLESNDNPMTVKTALQIINRELDEFFSGIEGEFDAETRFTITWFEQNGLDKGDSGTAINIAQARGIAVESVKHAGIVEYAAGKVRVLSRDEMEEDWSPEIDNHLTHWECCQYLIKSLENEGEFEAAVLMKKMGSDRADAAKDLAYRLYDICDKNGWAKEGTSYNGLIAVWSELTAQAATITDDQLVKIGNQMSML